LDAKRPSPPPLEQRTVRAMQLAADDAARQGQSSVTTENMLVGLLRVSGGVFADFFMGSGTDMPQLRALLGARLLPDTDPLLGQELPRDAAADAAIREAIAQADARRREVVMPLHVLSGIVSQRAAPGAQRLAEAGGTETRLQERLKAGL
jgi:ATP-dependent Clp protease ATP-binding subunit ClpA